MIIKRHAPTWRIASYLLLYCYLQTDEKILLLRVLVIEGRVFHVTQLPLTEDFTYLFFYQNANLNREEKDTEPTRVTERLVMVTKSA